MIAKDSVRPERNCALRSQLWDLMNSYLLILGQANAPGSTIETLTALCLRYCKVQLDIRLVTLADIRRRLRTFSFACEWYELFDLFGYVYKNLLHIEFDQKRFAQGMNTALRRHRSVYRLVQGDGRVLPVGSDSDREELEEVIASEDCPRAIRSRIASAMCHLDTKPVPELGDSVKDSVGAIEEVCNLLIDRAPGSNSGLSPDQLACLTEMQRGAEAFLKLHQCSRVARKVSHPLLDQPDVTLDDARTFFTSCVSFINHLLKRTREMEITMSAFA